jgi:predicted  nucleic acid-binding Zn-ribbon protein
MSFEALNAELQIVWQRIAALEREVEALKQQLANSNDERREFHQSRP